MGFRILAEAVVVIHFAFIFYAVFGAFLAWFFPKTAWIHLPVFFWAGAVMLAGWICPLTPLEISLREAAGEEGYDTGFIEHYLLPIIYPEALTRRIQVILGSLVLGWNLLLYVLIWFRRRRRGA